MMGFPGGQKKEKSLGWVESIIEKVKHRNFLNFMKNTFIYTSKKFDEFQAE